MKALLLELDIGNKALCYTSSCLLKNNTWLNKNMHKNKQFCLIENILEAFHLRYKFLKSVSKMIEKS